MLPTQPRAAPPCAIRDIFDRIGDKWSVVVLARLHDGPRTFGILGRSMEGVSRRMLSRTLRALERVGLISRTIRDTVPPTVEYALTPLGRGLVESLTAVARWADRHRDDIDAARVRYDACGKRPARREAIQAHAGVEGTAHRPRIIPAVTALLFEKSNVSKIVAKLSQLGLVEIAAPPGDARKTAVSASPRGRRVVELAMHALDQWNAAWLAALDDREVATVLAAVRAADGTRTRQLTATAAELPEGPSLGNFGWCCGMAFDA